MLLCLVNRGSHGVPSPWSLVAPKQGCPAACKLCLSGSHHRYSPAAFSNHFFKFPLFNLVKYPTLLPTWHTLVPCQPLQLATLGLSDSFKSIVSALVQFAFLSFLTRKSSADHHCIYAHPTAGILPSPRGVQSPRGESVGNSKELRARSLDWETPGLASKSQVGWDAHPTALVFVCLSAPSLPYLSVPPVVRPGKGV